MIDKFGIPANRSSQSRNQKTLIKHFMEIPAIKTETKFSKIKIDVFSFHPMISTLNKALGI